MRRLLDRLFPFLLFFFSQELFKATLGIDQTPSQGLKLNEEFFNLPQEPQEELSMVGWMSKPSLSSSSKGVELISRDNNTKSMLASLYVVPVLLGLIEN